MHCVPVAIAGACRKQWAVGGGGGLRGPGPNSNGTAHKGPTHVMTLLGYDMCFGLVRSDN